MEELIRQRTFGLICGYEDLSDHDALRDDALLAVAVGKQDATGEERARELRPRGADGVLALGGCSTQLPAAALGECAAAINEAFGQPGENDRGQANEPATRWASAQVPSVMPTSSAAQRFQSRSVAGSLSNRRPP